MFRTPGRFVIKQIFAKPWLAILAFVETRNDTTGATSHRHRLRIDGWNTGGESPPASNTTH